jgi:dihydropyrimidinase
MARTHDVAVRGGIVVTPMSAERLDVGIDGERIADVGLDVRGEKEIDATGLLVLPGVIDAHTHMALPVAGTRSSDGFESGTIAAACGGVTTIVDFTVGGQESTIPEDIERRREDATPAVVDYAFHAEVIGWRAGREWEIRDAIRLGVTSFKFYTAYEESGRRTSPEELATAFGALEEWDAVALVHAEDEALIASIAARLTPDEIRRMGTLAEARPDLCERAAIAQVSQIAASSGCRTHFVHVSSALGLEAVRDGRRAGAKLTAETCPQYLLLTRDVYDRADGRLFSASPALRTSDDQLALWNGLRHRDLDWVATDHCPFTVAQKAWHGDFRALPYGLPGVETLLPLLHSEGVGTGRLGLSDLPRLLSEGPARTLGFYPKKGVVAPGSDADLVLFDPRATWHISANRLHMNVDFSPYEGWPVTGRVATTIARGRVVFDGATVFADAGRGRYLPRES